MGKSKKGTPWIVFLLVLAILYPAKCLGQSQIEIVSSGWLAKEVERRQPILNEWIEAAQFAAGNDEEAKSAAVFLSALYLAVPAECKRSAVWIGTKPKNRLGALVFIREDSANSIWKKEFENTALANFEYPLIFIRPYQSGKLTKGLIALQQGYLAMHHSEIEDENSFYLTKVQCVEMLFRILSARFPGYEAMVKKQILLSESPSSFPQFDENGLQEIYGRAWQSERNFQRSLLWLHGVFKKIEEESYPENIRAKICFLSLLYEDRGEDIDVDMAQIK